MLPINALYPFSEDFVQRWSITAVDLAVSCLNRTLAILVEDAPDFKKSSDKQLKALSKALFMLPGPSLHLILALTLLWQSMSKSYKIDRATTVVDPSLIEHIEQMAVFQL